MVSVLNSPDVCGAAEDTVASAIAVARRPRQIVGISLSPADAATCTPAQSADEIVGKLRRAVLLDHRVGPSIVRVLQDRTLAELLAADDDGHRPGGPALLGMNGTRRHEIDLALRSR